MNKSPDLELQEKQIKDQIERAPLPAPPEKLEQAMNQIDKLGQAMNQVNKFEQAVNQILPGSEKGSTDSIPDKEASSDQSKEASGDQSDQIQVGGEGLSWSRALQNAKDKLVKNKKGQVIPLLDDYELQDLGEGFPILFKLIKYMTGLLLVLTVFFSAFTFAGLGTSFKYYEGCSYVKDVSDFVMFSLGGHLQCLEPEEAIKAQFEKRGSQVATYLLSVVMIQSLYVIGHYFIKWELDIDMKKIDEDLKTPSDFAVMVHAPEFSSGCDYSEKGIKAEIEEWIKDKFPETDGIEYVNVGYDISDFYEMVEKNKELQAQLDQVNSYIQAEGISASEYMLRTEKYKNFDGFPTKKKHSCCWGKGDPCGGWVLPPKYDWRADIPLNPDQIRGELKDVDTFFANEKSFIESGTKEERKKRYTGTVFVIFKRSMDMEKVAASAGEEGLLQDFWLEAKTKSFNFRAGNHTKFWTFKRAVEPQEINWENLNVSPYERRKKRCQAYFFLSILLLVNMLIVSSNTQAKESEVANQSSVGAYLVGIYIAQMNKIINTAITRAIRMEKPLSKTESLITQVISSSFLQFVNSSLLTYLSAGNSLEWFKNGTLVDTVSAQLITQATDPAVVLFVKFFKVNEIWDSINIFICCGNRCVCEMKTYEMMDMSCDYPSIEREKMSQDDINAIWEPTEFEIVSELTAYFNFISTCFLFCVIIPLAIPCAFVGSLCYYSLIKYRLLRLSTTPPYLSRQMGLFFTNQLPLTAIIWASFYASFLGKISKDYNAQAQVWMEQNPDLKDQLHLIYMDPRNNWEEQGKSYILRKQLGLVGNASLFFILGILIANWMCPFRNIVSKFIKKYDQKLSTVEQNLIYEETFELFEQDYDTANPFTNKAGMSRLNKRKQMKYARDESVGATHPEEMMSQLKYEEEQKIKDLNFQESLSNYVGSGTATAYNMIAYEPAKLTKEQKEMIKVLGQEIPQVNLDATTVNILDRSQNQIYTERYMLAGADQSNYEEQIKQKNETETVQDLQIKKKTMTENKIETIPVKSKPMDTNQKPEPEVIGQAPEEEQEKYCGRKSCCCCLMTCFWCIICCPLDKRPKRIKN